jgi:hypothetical protein
LFWLFWTGAFAFDPSQSSLSKIWSEIVDFQKKRNQRMACNRRGRGCQRENVLMVKEKLLENIYQVFSEVLLKNKIETST